MFHFLRYLIDLAKKFYFHFTAYAAAAPTTYTSQIKCKLQSAIAFIDNFKWHFSFSVNFVYIREAGGMLTRQKRCVVRQNKRVFCRCTSSSFPNRDSYSADDDDCRRECKCEMSY